MGRARSALRPLAARTYLMRNPRRVLPVALIQALVTALLVAVITPTNIFETTSEAYLRPLQVFTMVRPLYKSDFDEDLLKRLDEDPAAERHFPAKMFLFDTPMIVGEAVAPLLAVDEEVRDDLLRRTGVSLVDGRLPAKGKGEAALHRALLRARGLKIGDEFGQLADPDDSTPGRFRVVGVLDGSVRLGVIDLAYASIPGFVLARLSPFRIVYALPGRKTESDRWLKESAEDGHPVFYVVDESFMRSRIERNLRNLPLLIGFITGAVAVIVALVVSLLNLIAFQARTDEFALYLAVGHRRGGLVGKLVRETTATSVSGWLAGLALGIGALAVYRAAVLEPHGIVMSLLDARPLLFSLSVPLLSGATSALALAVKLHRMDPVAVLQRRGG